MLSKHFFEMSLPVIFILFPEVERRKHWFVQDRVLTAAPLLTDVARSVEEKVTHKTIFWPPTHNSQVNNSVLSQNSQSVHARAIWLQKHWKKCRNEHKHNISRSGDYLLTYHINLPYNKSYIFVIIAIYLVIWIMWRISSAPFDSIIFALGQESISWPT